MGTLILGLLAGTLTTLSPCILPLVPIVLAGALAEHRLAPLALIAGLVASFTATGLVVAGAFRLLHLDADVMRELSAGAMVLVGVVLASGLLRERLALAGSSFSNRLAGVASGFTPNGATGQFMLGALMGAVWAPCAGPTLGAAVSLAGEAATAQSAAGVMLMFALGASAPLLALSYGSREGLKKRRAVLAVASKHGNWLMGASLVALGALVLSGLDRRIEGALLGAMPDWLLDLVTRF